MVEPTVDPMVWLGKHLEEADTDLLREMVRTLIQALMSAEADAACGALYGERSPDRVNRPQWVPATDLRHQDRYDRTRRP